MDAALSDATESSGRKRLFAPWIWSPLLVGAASLAVVLLAACFPGIAPLMLPALGGIGLVLLYFLMQCVARLLDKKWVAAFCAFLRFGVLGGVSAVALGAMMFHSMFGPSEDHFADDLTIPEDVMVAEPKRDSSDEFHAGVSEGTDEMQAAVRAALAVSGGGNPVFVPLMPSLRRAATDHSEAFRNYIEASPDWHVFIEGGNHFAVRRWAYQGEPRDTLHGYISEFGEGPAFQTRCLLCLDRQPWSRYEVQHTQEGTNPVKPDMDVGNNLHQSRVMIECGGVWVEIFEQSGTPERRVTKATVATLEKEFAEFEKNSEAAVSLAQGRSRELARRLAGGDSQPFRLLDGMQPGIYGIAYSLNPGEPGVVYLKAFEITHETPLSADRLRLATETRMTWSDQPSELFGAKSGFTIYEGDWGKPYAARFEVWFKPDASQTERKLAERIYKIEGWQR